MNEQGEIGARTREPRAFIGRAREAEELRSAVRAALVGQGGLAVLSGEPGIGKTRLAEETANFALTKGANVVWGRCWEGGGAPAFWPWIQVIRESLHTVSSEILSQANHDLSLIAQMVPELRLDSLQQPSRDPSGAIQRPATVMQPEERFRLFDAVASFFKRIAGTTPLLMVLDDLHAADEDSLLLLAFVARELQQNPILVVATYRDFEVRRSARRSDILTEIGREGSSIALHGLSITEVAEFLDRSVKVPVDESTISSIHRVTDGNPFFLDELVRLLISTRESIGAEIDPVLSVPESVRATIRRRMAPLSEQTRAVLSIAAVIGQEFDLALLRDVSGVAEEQLLESCDEAIATVLVSKVAGSIGRYRFVHAMTVEALAAELSTSARARTHARIATTIERIYRDELEPHLAQIAYHYNQALPLGSVEKAVQFARRGASRAREQLAFAEAARLYGMAVRGLLNSPQRDEALRCELLLEMGESQAQSRTLDEARQSFERAAEVARKLRRPDLLCRAALGISTWFSSFFKIDTGVRKLVAEALAALGTTDTPTRATLMAKLAGELYWSGDHEGGRSLCDEAVASARSSGDPRSMVSALWVQNEINWGPDNVQARLDAATQIATLAESVGDYQRALRAREMRFTALLEMGDVGGLTTELFTYRALAEKWGEQFGIVERFCAALALLRGDFAEAERQIQMLWRCARRRQDPALLACAGYLEEFIATERAQIDPAKLESTRKALIAQSPAMNVIARAGLALFYSAMNRRSEAASELEALAKDDFSAVPRNWNWLAILCWLALVSIGVNDKERAGEIYRNLLPYSDRNVTLGWGDMAFGCVGRFLGMLAWKLGNFEQSEAHFEQALHFERRIGCTLWAAYTQFEYGRMLVKRAGGADKEKGLGLLRESHESAARMGLRLLEMRAAALITKSAADDGTRAPNGEPTVEPAFATSGPVSTRRSLATIMFVDIVGSTERLTEMKDRKWLDLRQHFFESVRKELERGGGREINTAGDSLLSIFNQPASAIRSALAMSEAVQTFGIQARTGIHTGECEISEGDVTGIAVHMAARVASCAGPNEVVVSSTVKELMAGGETVFTERGRHLLKGIPGEWNLYRVERSS
jgi:class 3 adenylate cyclase